MLVRVRSCSNNWKWDGWLHQLFEHYSPIGLRFPSTVGHHFTKEMRRKIRVLCWRWPLFLCEVMSISTENGCLFWHPASFRYCLWWRRGTFFDLVRENLILTPIISFLAQFISSNSNDGSGRSSGNLSISPCLLLQPITAQSLCHFILSF